MPTIHVRGGRPLAGYDAGGQRINVLKGDYDARLVEHLFPQDAVPQAALEISRAHGPNPLFVKCTEYTNEVEWGQFPDGGHPISFPLEPKTREAMGEAKHRKAGTDAISVLYVYRCASCGHRGDRHLPDDSHDGEASTCDECGNGVTLEWDGGVRLETRPAKR
ncbi:hypothetical protein AB4Y31_29325 [Trinickia sp. EG282A]